VTRLPTSYQHRIDSSQHRTVAPLPLASLLTVDHTALLQEHSIAVLSTGMTLEAIRYSRHGGLELLDQLQLPGRMVYDRVTTAEQGWQAIHSMRVRGAPAIAIAAALALASELALQPKFASALAAQEFILSRLAHLRTSRPTAVNLGQAVDHLTQVARVACSKQNASGSDVVEAYLKAAEDMLAIDLQANRSLGANGAEAVLRLRPTDAESVVRVLTHCNTGALATSGHGTALGVIRDLHAKSKTSGFKFEAFCTETRPYLQGARLTAFELVSEPASILTSHPLCWFSRCTKALPLP
jgi:methylthioribose-1-phosphate isomerase